MTTFSSLPQSKDVGVGEKHWTCKVPMLDILRLDTQTTDFSLDKFHVLSL